VRVRWTKNILSMKSMCHLNEFCLMLYIDMQKGITCNLLESGVTNL